jgi:phosphoribosylanthranilate isomerase
MSMKIKVCGMRQASNIEALVKLCPDFIGLIFYPKSKRFVGPQISPDIDLLIPRSLSRVGVFVNESFDDLIEKIKLNNLDIVQLHGDESVDYCTSLKSLGVSCIKAFGISSDFDFDSIVSYEKVCDYFLFDTSSELRGGTGVKFEWKKLNEYRGTNDFFLSGGINPGDVEALKTLNHPRLFAVDVNSGFEVEPGIKDIKKLESFILQLRG